MMSRKRCKRKVIDPLPPRGLRPKLTREQLNALGLCHNVNLDAIARGEAQACMLWDWASSIFTWSRVAQLLQVGEPEMTEQLQLCERLIDRYRRTGRVIFSGPDYQLAKDGVVVMDELAELVDRPTASQAAEWSEAKIGPIAAQQPPHQPHQQGIAA